MSAVFDRPDAFAYPAARRPRVIGRRPLTPRYVGVLAVWAALLVVRPRLALELWRNRRADSPIPRSPRV